MVLVIFFFVTVLSFDRYYPHYLNTCSNPQPTRLHIFWARVQNHTIHHLQRDSTQGWQSHLIQVQNCPSYATAHSLHYHKTTAKQVAISFVVDSYIGISPPLIFSDDDGYKVSWNGTVYEIVLENDGEIRNGVDPALANTSFIVSDELSSVQAWRWSYNLSTHLVPDQNNQVHFPNTTASNSSCVSIEYSFSQQVSFDHLRILIREEGSNYLPQKKLHQKEQCQAAAFTQLKRGQSYSYGPIKLINPDPQLQAPMPIFSLTPARIRFPWSFLWDDGFHQEVMVHHDPAYALDRIKSWLDIISKDGWIPRQQSRGPQREYLCNCEHLLKKDKRDGNPPSLILPITYLVKNHADLLQKNFPFEYYQKVKKWYSWYIDTQRSQLAGYLFKWFDSYPGNKSGGGSLNSGMDDFPRYPVTGGESLAHIDAQAWLYEFSKGMEELSHLYEPQMQENYRSIRERIKLTARQYLLDPSDHLFKDLARENNRTIFSPHLGYPSLLALAFGMLEQGSELQAAIALMQDPNKLNTGFGLSSLAQDSVLYYDERAYWRGPIWININYLVIRGIMQHYPSHKEVGQKLSQEILRTVCQNYEEDGEFYENYDGRSGKGTFAHPFTGWTTLINIFAKQGSYKI